MTVHLSLQKKQMRKLQRLMLLIIFVYTSVEHTTAQQTNTIAPDFIKPRMRVIIDNDFGGDPDGLFALVHILLSPSVDVRAVIGSHLNANDGFDHSKTQADNAAQKAGEVLKLMKLEGKINLIAGSNTGMQNDSTPVNSKGVDFIINEAKRTDTDLPLYVLCGAGLTEIASAVLKDPSIASKITLVWIGGPEYTDIAYPPPGYSTPEYNMAIDMHAAKAIFNKSAINIWQVPRNGYRQALLSYAEMITKVRSKGELGKYLTANIERVMKLLQNYKFKVGETYIIGDSPLVLLTALQSLFEADPSSSTYFIKTCPNITDQGTYAFNGNSRNIRVYDKLDINLMFNDFFAKLELFAANNK